jgi:tetratricopeptide (TPR) repeat protein
MLLDDEQNSLALLIEQARYELNCGDPRVAERYLDQAMLINDSEPLVKIERGVCKVRLSRPLEALEDVDPVLEENPRHPLALHVKADALYHLGNFEHALVFYHRGLRYSTQDPEIFRLGIRRAMKAIKNAIGPKVMDYFNTMSEIVQIIPQSVLAQPPHQISKFTKEEKKTMPKEASSSKPFLGPMHQEVKITISVEYNPFSLS